MKKTRTLFTTIERKKSFTVFYIRSVIIIMMLTNFNAAFAQQYLERAVLITPIYQKPPEVIISGSVKDIDGNPLENAMITTVSGNTYVTGNTGEFSFKLKGNEVMVQNIFASYKGLVTGVRSYDPAMTDAFYDIILYKPVKCCPRVHRDSIAIEPPALYFENNGVEISVETKKILDSISNILKENPAHTILLTANSGPRKSLQQLAEMRLNAIRRRLIERNGISSDRIKIQKVTDSRKTNSINIKIE